MQLDIIYQEKFPVFGHQNKNRYPLSEANAQEF